MFIGRTTEKCNDCKKSSPALHNTFTRPPMGHLEGIYIRTLTLEGVFGYVPTYADDLIRDDE